jgi:hypothetical protein
VFEYRNMTENLYNILLGEFSMGSGTFKSYILILSGTEIPTGS